MTSSNREGIPCSGAASLRAVLASGGVDALGVADSCLSAANGFCAAKYDPPNDAQKKIAGTKSFVRMLAPSRSLLSANAPLESTRLATRCGSFSKAHFSGFLEESTAYVQKLCRALKYFPTFRANSRSYRPDLERANFKVEC
jgi:hypothetical protein